MTEITIPRKQVILCALSNSAIKTHLGDKVYRIDSHKALERMLNGHGTYELTTVSVVFTGAVDIEDAEITHRLFRNL